MWEVDKAAVLTDVQRSSDRHGCQCFHGEGAGLIHPIKREIGRRLCRKTGGWWYGWRRRRWITNMIQGEEIRSVSWRACSAASSTITQLVLSDFDLCYSQWWKEEKKLALVYLQTMDHSVSYDVSLTLFQTTQGDSWCGACCAVGPAVWGVSSSASVWPRSRCVSQLPVFSMADLPALGLGN